MQLQLECKFAQPKEMYYWWPVGVHHFSHKTALYFLKTFKSIGRRILQRAQNCLGPLSTVIIWRHPDPPPSDPQIQPSRHCQSVQPSLSSLHVIQIASGVSCVGQQDSQIGSGYMQRINGGGGHDTGTDQCFCCITLYWNRSCNMTFIINIWSFFLWDFGLYLCV